MGVTCTMFILCISTRLQFRMAGEAVPSTLELGDRMSQDRCLPLHPPSTKSRCPEAWVKLPGTTSEIAHKHDGSLDNKAIMARMKTQVSGSLVWGRLLATYCVALGGRQIYEICTKYGMYAVKEQSSVWCKLHCNRLSCIWMTRCRPTPTWWPWVWPAHFSYCSLIIDSSSAWRVRLSARPRN